VGDAYYNLKQYSAARQTYQRVVKEFPKSKEAAEADFGIVLSLYQEKRYDTFIARVETFLKRYPQHPLASIRTVVWLKRPNFESPFSSNRRGDGAK
jgi:TolA-binding protein